MEGLFVYMQNMGGSLVGGAPGSTKKQGNLSFERVEGARGHRIPARCSSLACAPRRRVRAATP